MKKKELAELKMLIKQSHKNIKQRHPFADLGTKFFPFEILGYAGRTSEGISYPGISRKSIKVRARDEGHALQRMMTIGKDVEWVQI